MSVALFPLLTIDICTGVKADWKAVVGLVKVNVVFLTVFAVPGTATMAIVLSTNASDVLTPSVISLINANQ